MSSLSIFPSEILEWITSVVSTSHQMRLWQCGDRILNFKLKNGGLKRTSLCWSGYTWMPWPRWYFTTFGGLVDVEWGMAIGKSLCPTLELNLLPKTLKRLYLAFDDVFILLRRQNINMHDILPNLQSLRLSGCYLREQNLKNLPSHLIELDVASLGDTIESSTIFGDLPRHIERLRLAFCIVDLSELENDLPSQLISIDISHVVCDFNWFSKLPRLLKTLNIFYECHDQDWMALPPQLELFSTSLPIPKSVLPLLPQSLKILLANLREFIEEDVLFPKNLTKFELKSERPFHERIDHSGLQRLPASLTDFDATVSATHPDIISFYHPDSIKIRIGFGPCAYKLTAFPFPAKLQLLELYYINDDICAMLPPGLQTLRLGEGHITSKGASKFPKQLTSLTVCLEMFDDIKSMPCLRNIASITLMARECDKLNDWISSLLPPSSSESSSNHDCISTNINGFNHHLTSLQVYVAGGYGNPNIQCVKKPFFEVLAKCVNLEKLQIPFLEGISGDWLCLIPKKVTYLTICNLTTLPTAIQLSTLPQCLNYLDIQVKRMRGENCTWNDEILQSLPRTLQTFVLRHGPCPYLTQRMYEYLPPNLQVTSLRFEVNGSPIEFRKPVNRLYGLNGDGPVTFGQIERKQRAKSL